MGHMVERGIPLGLSRLPGLVLRFLEDGERDFRAVGRFTHHMEHLTTTDIGFRVVVHRFFSVCEHNLDVCHLTSSYGSAISSILSNEKDIKPILDVLHVMPCRDPPSLQPCWWMITRLVFRQPGLS